MAADRLASTPPRLYKAVGMYARGFSGGASRHCPPVPAMLKRLMHNFPSLRMKVRLKMRKETKR